MSTGKPTFLYPGFTFMVFTMALFILTSQQPAYPIRGSAYTFHLEIPGTDSLSDNRGRESGLLQKLMSQETQEEHWAARVIIQITCSGKLPKIHHQGKKAEA